MATWREEHPERDKAARKARYSRQAEGLKEELKTRYEVDQGFREKTLTRVRLRSRETKTWMSDLKSKTPCTDCGKCFPPTQMDWDHLPDSEKVDKVSAFVKAGRRKAAEDEIKKCELVCKPCHRIRTADRRL